MDTDDELTQPLVDPDDPGKGTPDLGEADPDPQPAPGGPGSDG